MVKYDIVKVPFIYEDDITQFKARPAVVLDNNNIAFLGAKVTGSNPRTHYDYPITDWREAGLTKPCCVRLDKTQQFNLNDVLKIYGHLSDRDIAGIESILNESLTEDTEKKSNGKWVNKGSDGEHGEFKTKKEADAQRKAMFANGYKS